MNSLNGQVVKIARIGLNLTHRELARKAQVSQTQVCLIENGLRVITPEVGERLVKALGLNGNFHIHNLIRSFVTKLVKYGELTSQQLLAVDLLVIKRGTNATYAQIAEAVGVSSKTLER